MVKAVFQVSSIILDVSVKSNLFVVILVIGALLLILTEFGFLEIEEEKICSCSPDVLIFIIILDWKEIYVLKCSLYIEVEKLIYKIIIKNDVRVVSIIKAPFIFLPFN